MPKAHQTAAPAVPERQAWWPERLLWLCPVVGLIAGAVILWLFGLTLWTAVVVALLIACPLVLVWLLLVVWRQGPATGRRS